MNDRRRGLGRGLGALIPTVPLRPEEQGWSAGAASETSGSPVDVLIPERSGGEPPSAGSYYTELEPSAIRPNSRQPRQVFDEDALEELVTSIREVGLLQPVVVRPLGEGAFELVMGERRWRASQQAGLATIPVIVRATDDNDMLRDALLENLHRSQLNPLEEAAAYDQLLQDFGCSHEELAARIGRSRPQITNTLRLLRLPSAVQAKVAAGVLSAGHARALLALPDAATQEQVANRIVAEGLSVRAVEELAALGESVEEARGRPSRANRPVAPRLEDIAARLSDRLETRVRVDLGRRKGKVVVEFASIDDLERIVGILAPDNDGDRLAPIAGEPMGFGQEPEGDAPSIGESADGALDSPSGFDHAEGGVTPGEGPAVPDQMDWARY